MLDRVSESAEGRKAWWLAKARRWRTLPIDDRRLARDLLTQLAVARFQVSWLPFRSYASKLGPVETPVAHVDREGDEASVETIRLLRRVRSMTSTLSAATPWRSTCLVQALAAYRVLERRGCRASLFLGVKQGAADLEAHAWLALGPRVITGQAVAEQFAPVAVFRGSARRHAAARGDLVVFYDSACGFCQRWIEWAVRHDRHGRLAVSSRGGETFRRLVPADVVPTLPDSILVLDEGGTILSRSSAALKIGRSLGGIWRIAATTAALVPRSLRDRVYDFIAARRRTIAGGVCPAPSTVLRERLLP
jgi:predicted DCC family thiol-disulfide oxidoreductase YuxK